MYEWHDSLYLGAAHGVSGIMYILLHLSSHLTQSELQDLIKPTVDYLATLRSGKTIIDNKNRGAIQISV